YQTGLGIEALRALANLAHLTGKEDASKELEETFQQQKPLMNETFWLADKKRFAFALDKSDHPVDEPSVLATVPMWFGLLDKPKADAMITRSEEHTSELQSLAYLVCRLLLEKKKNKQHIVVQLRRGLGIGSDPVEVANVFSCFFDIILRILRRWPLVSLHNSIWLELLILVSL